MRGTRILWMSSLVLLAAQALLSYAELPARMASHLDLQGHPNDWTSRESFYLLWLVAVAAVNVWVPFVPRLIRRIPSRFWNMPNKEYWLRDDSRRRLLETRLASLAEAIAVPANVLLLVAFQTVYQYNTEGRIRIPTWIFWALVGIVAAVALIYPFRALRTPRGGRADEET
jgi:uncharacterized membrane protein